MSGHCPGISVHLENAGVVSTFGHVRAHAEALHRFKEPRHFLRHLGALNNPRSPIPYQRRKPEDCVLHSVVGRNLRACLETAQERSEHGYGYPAFVEREFRKYLGCGQLRRGFVRVQCSDCVNERLVAFSCKGRGFCPSCTARRMADTAAHLVDKVLPALPYRQWVLSVPRRVRILLAIEHDLLSAVLDMALRKIFACQKRRARRLGVAEPMCGAIAFVQRFGSLLNLNCHFHNILPDGVFVEEDDGDVAFRPIPPPMKADVQRLVEQIARGTEKLIAKHANRHESDERPGVLATEQAQSIGSRSAASGVPWDDAPPSRRQASHYGYSLHAERIVNSDDRDGLERLCRYASRAPIAKSRLSLAVNGQVVVKLKRPLRDGRRELRFGQVELLQKLAILIPPPRKNLTRYFGVFGPAHRHRAAVVGIGRAPAVPGSCADVRPARKRAIPWAELLRRVFAIDILKCEKCGGDMKIIAIIPASEASEAILDHRGIDDVRERATGPPADANVA